MLAVEKDSCYMKLKKILPSIQVFGFDVSKYGIKILKMK